MVLRRMFLGLLAMALVVPLVALPLLADELTNAPTGTTMSLNLMPDPGDEQQPAKNSVATIDFDLCRCFQVAFEKPELKAVERIIEDWNSQDRAVQRTAAKRSAADEDPAIIDRDDLASLAITAGTYTLHQTFEMSATNPNDPLPGQAAAAEVAPEPAVDPLWLSY